MNCTDRRKRGWRVAPHGEQNELRQFAREAINALIWTHGAESLTLAEADALACEFLEKIRKEV